MSSVESVRNFQGNRISEVRAKEVHVTNQELKRARIRSEQGINIKGSVRRILRKGLGAVTLAASVAMCPGDDVALMASSAALGAADGDNRVEFILPGKEDLLKQGELVKVDKKRSNKTKPISPYPVRPASLHSMRKK